MNCNHCISNFDLGVRMKRFQSLIKSLSVSRGEYFPGVMMGKHVMKLIRGKNERHLCIQNANMI